MWKRFDDDARKIVYYAQEAAAATNVRKVVAEHLLLGILRDDCLAVRILTYLGVDLAGFRNEIRHGLRVGNAPISGEDMELAPSGKRAIDLAYSDYKRLKSQFIGSEHLLLGIIADAKGYTEQVLKQNGVTRESVLPIVEAVQSGSLSAADLREDPAVWPPPPRVSPSSNPVEDESQSSSIAEPATDHRRTHGVFNMWSGLTQFGWQIRDLLKKQVMEVQSQSTDSDVWEVFTRQGRKALLSAQTEARRLQSAHVTCELLLNAILADESCTAVAILVRLGVNVDQLRSHANAIATRDGGTASDQVRLTDTCRRVANTAHNEMSLLRNTYIGTEHLLIGITRETGEPAGKLLKRVGVTDSRVSKEIAALQGGPDRNWPGSNDIQDGVWPPPPMINPPTSL